MKVHELIERLLKLPQDRTVVIQWPTGTNDEDWERTIARDAFDDTKARHVVVRGDP